MWLPAFVKLNIMILFEVAYNLYKNLFGYRVLEMPKQKKKRTAIITGGSKGIGAKVVEKLVNLNFKVIILARDIKAMKELQRKFGDNISFYVCNLANLNNLQSVISTIKCEHEDTFDLLINNAGVYCREIIKKNDIELNMLVNYYAHFMICKHIKAKKILNVSSSVIYSVSSIKDRNYVVFMENYAQSKLANILHALHLKNQGIDAVAVHPGIVATELFDKTLYGKFVRLIYFLFPFLFTKLDDAANNILYAAFSDLISDDQNKADYFLYLNRGEIPEYINIEAANALNDKTERILQNSKSKSILMKEM